MRALTLVGMPCFGAVQSIIPLLRCIDGAGIRPKTIAAAVMFVTDVGADVYLLRPSSRMPPALELCG